MAIKTITLDADAIIYVITDVIKDVIMTMIGEIVGIERMIVTTIATAIIMIIVEKPEFFLHFIMKIVDAMIKCKKVPCLRYFFDAKYYVPEYSEKNKKFGSAMD